MPVSDHLDVIGGRGGTRARLDDLERASALLSLVARHLAEVGRSARRASRALDLDDDVTSAVGAALQPHVAGLRRVAVERLAWIDVGSGGATAASEEVNGLAQNLAATVGVLEAAERETTSIWSRLDRGWDKLWALGEIAVWVPLKVVGSGAGWVIDRVEDIPAVRTVLSPVLGGAGWLADTVNPDWVPNPGPLLYGDDLQTLLRLADIPVRAVLWVPRSVVVGLGGDMPDGFAELVAADLAVVTSALDSILGNPHGLVATPVACRRRNAPDGVEGVLSRLESLSPTGADGPGRIAIERIEHADGTIAWIIEIPGTQVWAPDGGSNVFDMTSNGLLLATGVSDVTLGIEEAMRIAGVSPGDPVMLVGHSQGGIAAVALASSPTFLSRYNVTAVATAGAPTGRFTPGDGVQVLSVEHTSDTVPALDAAPNPDRVNWTTVRRDLSQSSDPVERAADHDIVDRHELESYIATGRVIDTSADPSIRGWREAAAPFLSPDDGSSVRVVYDLVPGTASPVVIPPVAPSPAPATPYPQGRR